MNKNNRKVAEFFDNVAYLYMKKNNKYILKKRAAFIKKFIGPDDKVLDVGVGWGELAKAYKKGPLTGCDISKTMIELSRKRLPESDFIVCDAENLLVDTGSFDVIVSSELIYYLANPDYFFHECKRVLKPEGKLILCWGNNNYSIIYKILIRLGLIVNDHYVLKAPSRKKINKLSKSIFGETRICFYGIGLPGNMNASLIKLLTLLSPVNGLVINSV